jgi:hypothetical protein
MTVTTVPINQLTRALQGELDYARRWAKQTRDELGLQVLTSEQQAQRFPVDDAIIGRINAVPTKTDPISTFRRAKLTDTVDFTTSSATDNLAEIHRILMSALQSAAPFTTGRYKASFETWLNGERVVVVPVQGSGGRSIFAVFNRATYASPLEVVKQGGIFQSAALRLAARYPRYKINFQYRLPTDLTQDARISPRTGNQQRYAVPVIFVGTPSSNLPERIAVPGRNARRRNARAARAAARAARSPLTTG